MRAIRVDFAPGRKARWKFAALVLVALSCAAAITYVRYHATEVELSQLQDALQTMQRERVQQMRERVPDEPSKKQEKEAQLVISRLAFPWQEFFEAVEAAHAEDVALLELDPDTVNGSLRIYAETRDFTAAAHYVRNWQEHGQFSNVILADHKLQTMDPQGPVRITVVAKWKHDFVKP